MSYRGRRGGYNASHFAQDPFQLFPKIEQLPEINNVKEERELVQCNLILRNFWNSSPYYYEGVGDASFDKDVEKAKTKAPLSHYIKMTGEYVPAELAEKRKRGQKRVRWNPEADTEKLDLFEKLEQNYQGKDGEKDNKEDEDEEENDGIVEDEEYSDEGDYDQNIDFDDDEDDFNMGDDNDDEATY